MTHEETGPKPIDEEDLDAEDGAAYICQCGLSDDRPFCDGSHTATTDEEDRTVYKYEHDDKGDKRREIKEIRYADE